MGIANGTFDSDLNGWTTTVSGDADVIWDNGRARLRVYRCSYATMTQDIMINRTNLSFDWETGYDWFPELPKWQLIVSGVPVISENFRICSVSECQGRNSRFSGTNTVDVSTYMGQIATLKFYIDPYPGYCSYPDHANSYLWIDNVQLITLSPEIGHLEIYSDPPEAEIYIDEYKLSDLTPTIIDMPVGLYSLRVHKDGYADYVELIIITADFTLYRSVELPYIVTGKGSLYIRSTPPGAKIYIDNILQLDPYDQPLLTPITITGISVGSHDVKLALIGYQDWVDTVPVEETTIIIVDATFVILNITAIDITVTPSDPCVEGICIVDVSVTWQNTGDIEGSFVPNISINGTPITPIYQSEPLGVGLTTTHAFTVSGLTKVGSPHSICPYPN